MGGAVTDTYRSLLLEAFLMRRQGERAPGAPPWPAETWRDWEVRCEAFLRDPANCLRYQA
jgi:hypothetical protein